MTDRDDFRGGNPPAPKTQTYPFGHPKVSTVEPTIPMDAVELLTVKDIIHRLVERNLQAWRALPEAVRDRMLERPQDFRLVGNKLYNGASKENFDYDIVYNGTLWRYNGAGVNWVLADIIR